METNQYSVENKSADSSLSARVKVIDGAVEPLRVLKVLVEGLASDENVGLWLRHLNSIPMVPRLSPFDLAYLDENDRVVQGVELLPDADLPPLESPSVSALILPFHTISATKTKTGDQLTISEAEGDLAEPEVNAAREFAVVGNASTMSAGHSGRMSMAAGAPVQAMPAIEILARPVVKDRANWNNRNNGSNGSGAAAELSHAATLAQFLQSHELRNSRSAENASPVPQPRSEKVAEFPVVGAARFIEAKHSLAELVTMPLQPEAKVERKDEARSQRKLGPLGWMVRWLYRALSAEDQRKELRGHWPELVAHDPADAEAQVGVRARGLPGC